MKTSKRTKRTWLPLWSSMEKRPINALLFAVPLVILGFVLIRTFAATPTQVSTTQVASGGNDSSCTFQKADRPTSVAFCESFGVASNNPASSNRSGDLDNQLWGVSRLNTHVNPSQGQINSWLAATIQGCGADIKSLAPKDVQVCNGRLQEAVNDGHSADGVLDGGQSTLAIYPKQPFDFAGRTGTVSFDVSADSAGNHNAWPEFWLTDQPIPAPVDHRSGNAATPRNGLGIVFSNNDGACPAGTTGIERIAVVRDYVVTYADFDNSQYCNLKTTSATGASLNHVEIRMSQSHVDVWANDGGTTALKLMASANINLSISRGLVWMVDAHYNACKDGFGHSPQCDHDFAWDNLGFDGPSTYRDLSFDVVDGSDAYNSYTTNLGYAIANGSTKKFAVNGVYRIQTPTSALVTFNFYPTTVKFVPSFRLVYADGSTGPWHDTTWPFSDSDLYTWRSIGVSVPVSEIHDGNSSIEIKNSQPGDQLVVSNINAILVAASPVPGQTTPPAPTPTPALKDGDVNSDGSINVFDASIVSANWGKTGVARAQGDLNGDGTVNVFDASIVSANWGK